MKNLPILLVLIFAHHLSFGQNTMKKTMDENVFAIWKTIERPAISNNGNWVVYQLKPHEGDSKLKIYNTNSYKEYTFDRGGNARITDDSKFVIFKIKPHVESIKEMKRRKVKKKDLTKDSLGIYDLEKKSLTKIANVKSFKVPEKWSGHIAYLREIQTFEKGDTTSVKPKKKETKDSGTKLTLRNLKSGDEVTYTYVKNYQLAEEGKMMMFTSTGNDSNFFARSLYV